MATRAIVACGYDFSPHGGSFAGAGVAHDEIVGPPPPAEPLVLRMMATGGDVAEWARRDAARGLRNEAECSRVATRNATPR